LAKKTRNIILSCGTRPISIRLVVDHQCDKRTDRLTDGQTYDGNSVRLTTHANKHIYTQTEVKPVLVLEWEL